MVIPSRGEAVTYLVLEALAAGIPLVATNAAGIREVFGDNGARLVPPGDPSALADAMAAAYAAPVRAVQAAARLREDVRHRFSIDAMMAAVEDPTDRRWHGSRRPIQARCAPEGPPL